MTTADGADPTEQHASGRAPRALRRHQPQGVATPAGLEIRVAELVLDGLSPRHGERLRRTVEVELSRLLAERGAPRGLMRPADVLTVEAGAGVQGGQDDAALGRSIALAVLEGLGT